MVACTLFRRVSLVVRYLFSCGSKYNADGRYMCRSLEPHKAQVQVMLYTDGNVSSSISTQVYNGIHIESKQ